MTVRLIVMAELLLIKYIIKSRGERCVHVEWWFFVKDIYMGKFVRIEGSTSRDEEVVMLNLDLVAKAKITPQKSYRAEEPSRAYITLESDDQLILATFYLDTMEEGKRWVLQHLGIDL